MVMMKISASFPPWDGSPWIGQSLESCIDLHVEYLAQFACCDPLANYLATE